MITTYRQLSYVRPISGYRSAEQLFTTLQTASSSNPSGRAPALTLACYAPCDRVRLIIIIITTIYTICTKAHIEHWAILQKMEGFPAQSVNKARPTSQSMMMVKSSHILHSKI